MKKPLFLPFPTCTDWFNVSKKNLRFLGFDVINLCYDDRDSWLPELGQQTQNLYHKHITKDGNYKKYLKYSRHF